jgi:hypothetical protein
MKTILTYVKGFSLVMVMTLLAMNLNAAVRTASVSGNWNSIATWGGLSVPVTGDDVIINSGITVTVTANAACKSITTTGGTLNVTGGDITMDSPGTVTINTGGSVVFSATNTIKGGGNGGNGVTVAINAGATLTTANAAGFILGVNNTTVGGSFAVNRGTGTGPTYSIGANYTYNGGAQSSGTGITGAVNLTLAGTGNKTLSVTTTVTGTVSMQGSAVLVTAPTYSGASSTVEYNGGAAQTTTNIDFPTTNGPANLKINNSAGVTLHAARTITGALTLTSGVLVTTGANLLTISGTNAGGGGSASSHVNGPLAKTGTTDFQFPVGNGTLYRPITISALSATATVTASYTQANPKTTFGTAVGSGIDHIGVCEYWNLDDGVATITGITALQFGGSCNGNAYVNDAATLRVAHWNGAQWDNLGNDGSATLTTVKATTSSTFSPFTIGSSSPFSNPLPVKFSGITAFEKQQGIQINWKAYSEDNLNKYVIERSSNGQSFTSIGEVTARNVTTETQYGFFDANPLPGVNFYRLRAVDVDGKSGYSTIVRVNLAGVKEVTIYPNPVTGGYVSFQSGSLAKGNYTVKIFNATGQQVYSEKFAHNGGAVNQTIQLPSGSRSGMYSLQLNSDEMKLMSKTFMVQ